MQFEGMRYEVLVNGMRRCIAGTVGPGSLVAVLTRWRSGVRDAPAESAHLMVHGSRTANELSVRWLLDELGPGDEVVIRILDAGECDEPSHSARSDA